MHNCCPGSRWGGLARWGRGGQVWGSCPVRLADTRRAGRRAQGKGGEGGAGGRPPLHPCPAAGLPQPTESPPPPIHGFFPTSASVLTNQQILRKQTPSEPQAGSDSAAAPPQAQKEFPRFWDRGRPAGLQASSWPAPHRPAVGQPAAPTQADTLVSKPKSSGGE